MTAQLLTSHPGPFASEFASNRDRPDSHPEPMALSEDSPPQDDGRGRRRNRDAEPGDDGDLSPTGLDDGQGGPPGSSRKRRRSRKGLDKKFECPHDGCGKSYSRAEHLYRHQLNHNPKQIYYCDFTDCNRSFVRQDLCARHKERHLARGSQLLRKDTFMHNPNPIVAAANLGRVQDNLGKPKDYSSPPKACLAIYLQVIILTFKQSAQFGGSADKFLAQSPASAVTSSHTLGRSDSSPSDAQLQSPTHEASALRNTAYLNRTASNESNTSSGTPGIPPRSVPQFGQQQRTYSSGSQNSARPQFHPSYTSSDGFSKPSLQQQPSFPSYTPTPPPPQSYTPTQPPPPMPAHGSYQSHHNIPPFTTLPPPGFNTMTQSPINRAVDAGYGPTSAPTNANAMNTSAPADARMNSVSQQEMLENMTPSYSMPVFGGEGYSRSPFAMADDFTAWLFNDSQFGPNAPSPMGYPQTANMSNMIGSAAIGLQAPYFNYDPVVSGYMSQPPVPAQHPMAVNSILDTTLPESTLSDDKRQELLDHIEERFNEREHAPVKRQKEELFAGNRDDDRHVLSLHMMQKYITSYWVHFHPQMPILHRPTFNPGASPNLLIIAMMSLGASCLEKSYGQDITTACSELAGFLAWHLRWEIFMDADFRPPAKLWVFQALLLLEIFEKMYSTRPLHERAHIHHATTLTLMRRGSSLIGRSALDSPPSVKDGKHGSISSMAGASTPEEWWNHWITNEATRRAAFAAFVMDSTHATMFGHSAVMVAHEMRLPLPCDEALWSATTSAEVGRVEASLHSNGVKPTTFLDGLKKTLNGQSVRTNSFGRTILMAGLLSVSWHMNQRDLQVSSLGVSQALGGRDKWRGSLTRAFDFWKQDFDQSLAQKGDLHSPTAYQYSNGLDDENVFESRVVLHHLAHMAMHVDIVDCQIFAGANRLLGRSITTQDSSAAQRRMKETWAPTARARDATFYALKFLSQILLPEGGGHSGQAHHHTSNGNPMNNFEYSAREDFLFNRPWVLYFATLIVWSYGFALDGPIKPVYQLNSREDMVRDMQGYLRRVGGVRAPDDLAKATDRNACLGMLLLLREMFRKARWELMHEASNLLSKCIDMLTPSA